LARRWADLARVHIRVLTDLGGTEHDIEAARAALDRACALDPHLPWYWLERARLERIVGSGSESIRFVRRALDEEPNTVRAWLMLSRLELEAGRMDEARAALDEATTRAALISRRGLTDYERELLLLPESQLNFLARALAVDRDVTLQENRYR
jgi:tetratricopeptide (TPR) repeat protein